MKPLTLLISLIFCQAASSETLSGLQSSLGEFVVPVGLRSCVTSLTMPTDMSGHLLYNQVPDRKRLVEPKLEINVRVKISCGKNTVLNQSLATTSGDPEVLPIIVERMAELEFRTNCSTSWRGGFKGQYGEAEVLCIHAK